MTAHHLAQVVLLLCHGQPLFLASGHPSQILYVQPICVISTNNNKRHTFGRGQEIPSFTPHRSGIRQRASSPLDVGGRANGPLSQHH